MKELVWVGLRESEIKYSNFIDKSISIFGNNSNSLENQIKQIEILDKMNDNIKCENLSYLDTEIYDKPIFKFFLNNC